MLSFGRVNTTFRPDTKLEVSEVDSNLRGTLRDHLIATPTDDLPSSLRDTGRIIFDLLAYLLPVDYVENLPAYLTWACRTADRCLPHTVVTGYGLLDTGAFPFYAAECAARNTRLIGWQHGGTYGELGTPGRVERWERRLTNAFLTWGWDDHDPKLIDAPCPRQKLFKRKRKPTEGKARLLWVSTSDSRFTHFIDHTPVGDRLKDYFRHQEALLAALPPEIVARLVLRPNRHDFGWHLKDMWKQRLEAPTFSPDGTLILDEADRCGMVLIDYPGSTAFLECLAASVPFLCVLDPAVYQIRPSQAAAFRALEKTGVVHTSPKAAAVDLVEALQDPDAWQNEPNRRRALDNIRDIAMRRDPGYIRTWLRAIT